MSPQTSLWSSLSRVRHDSREIALAISFFGYSDWNFGIFEPPTIRHVWFDPTILIPVCARAGESIAVRIVAKFCYAELHRNYGRNCYVYCNLSRQCLYTTRITRVYNTRSNFGCNADSTFGSHTYVVIFTTTFSSCKMCCDFVNYVPVHRSRKTPPKSRTPKTHHPSPAHTK